MEIKKTKTGLSFIGSLAIEDITNENSYFIHEFL